MKSLLIKQAIFIPLLAMLTPVVVALFLPGYSSISQHISEVALLDHPIAPLQRLAAIVTGVSILLFALGVFLAPLRLGFTSLAAAAFGASMVSNGLFVMGSPLHGLYGLGFFMVLVPAFFAAEVQLDWRSRAIKKISLLTATITMTYLWLMLSGFDPAEFRGLTQRAATLIIFGWYSAAGYWLVRPMISVLNARAVELVEDASAG